MDLQHHAFDTPAAALQALAKVQEQEEEEEEEEDQERCRHLLSQREAVCLVCLFPDPLSLLCLSKAYLNLDA